LSNHQLLTGAGLGLSGFDRSGSHPRRRPSWIEEIQRCPNPHHATIGRRLILRSLKHKAKQQGLRVHTLQELYE
jgi:hypothetical protein